MSYRESDRFGANKQDTKIHFVFECPVYDQSRSEHLSGIISVRDFRKHLATLIDKDSQETILNVAKFLVCVFHPRSSKVVADT